MTTSENSNGYYPCGAVAWNSMPIRFKLKQLNISSNSALPSRGAIRGKPRRNQNDLHLAPLSEGASPPQPRIRSKRNGDFPLFNSLIRTRTPSGREPAEEVAAIPFVSRTASAPTGGAQPRKSPSSQLMRDETSARKVQWAPIETVQPSALHNSGSSDSRDYASTSRPRSPQKPSQADESDRNDNTDETMTQKAPLCKVYVGNTVFMYKPSGTYARKYDYFAVSRRTNLINHNRNNLEARLSSDRPRIGPTRISSAPHNLYTLRNESKFDE